EGEANRVRFMTIHGAKGLEAPIVYLPDTIFHEKGLKGADNLLYDERQGLVLWKTGKGNHPIVQELCDHKKQKDGDEKKRLLYVALTRARDRLYIGGFLRGNAKERNDEKDNWYNAVHEAMMTLHPVQKRQAQAPWGGEAVDM